MFFDKLYILKGIFDGHDFSQDLYDYMADDRIRAELKIIKTDADFSNVLSKIAHTKEKIALHLDMHGDNRGVQFGIRNQCYETWDYVNSLFKLINSNTSMPIVTMNICHGAAIIWEQAKDGSYLDNLIASCIDVNASECCSRCHLFYSKLHQTGDIDQAMKEFNTPIRPAISGLALYKSGCRS